MEWIRLATEEGREEMKHILMWVFIVIGATILWWVMDKTTFLTTFETEESSWVTDTICILLGLSLVISRGISLWNKIF
jgi:hypothetical protein